MKTRVLSAALTLMLVTPLAVAAQNPVTESLHSLFTTTKTNIMATAEMLDEEMYAFRPTDEVRSVGEMLAHIANAQYLFCSSAAGEESPRRRRTSSRPGPPRPPSSRLSRWASGTARGCSGT